jgi:hypothetical protein
MMVAINLSPRAALLADVPLKIGPEVFERALQRLDRAGGKRAEGVARP